MRATRMLSCFAPIVAAGLLSGYGGGGLTGGAPDVVVNAPSTLDGYVTSAGGVLATASTGVAVGDNAGNDGRRGFLRFSLGTDGDSFEDSTHLEDLENSRGTGQAPVLVITCH